MSDLPTVLFVDDEERILRSLRLLFRGKAKVLTTTSGREAVERVREQPVHVVVSDQRMPGMTGVEVLREVREHSPSTMRVLLTGYADLSAIVASVNEGEIFRFVEKPWNAVHLVETVGQAAALARVAFASVPAPLPPGARVLVLERVPDTVTQVQALLPPSVEVRHASSVDASLEYLAEHECAVLVADLPPGSAEIAAAIKTLKQHSPQTVCIVAAHFRDARVLIGLINEGQVFRFLPRPLSRELLRRSLVAALARYAEFRAAPALVQRHAVEPARDAAAGSLSGRLAGVWKRIRERSALRA